MRIFDERKTVCNLRRPAKCLPLVRDNTGIAMLLCSSRMAGISNNVAIHKYIPQKGNGGNYMICRCDDCGFVGISEGTNSNGWAIIHKCFRDSGGRVIAEIWKKLCPACVEKYQSRPKPKNQYQINAAKRFEEPED